MLAVLFLLMNNICYGQLPKVFTKTDLNLQGNVKSCLVITDYGKEAYEFNKEGMLTKLTTLYSATDYDISYYKYSKGLLKEKRSENYREDILDRQTSIANIYFIDTLRNKIVKELIYSYQKDFLEQYDYFYDESGTLATIKRRNNEGIDEIQISYDSIDGESTQTTSLNGIVDKTLRRSFYGEKKKKNLINVLEKEYVSGEPYKATEVFQDSLGRKQKELLYTYDAAKSSFVQTGEHIYEYEEHGFLSKKKTLANNKETKQEYIYQLDAHQPPNWIKQIITPSNKYTTRRLVYYEEELPQE
ncbi:hypothetical protein [uncultured Muriicola sp.]|uniref:hypothetical protein n=1 Tax=uncultured Muriicola sp. TaxID=1583102 RepID=UPI0026383896|nr:hypothetical protein [uncultured Muriicola sp.]